MLITLKTLQEDTFTVEVDPMETIRSFKEKIEKVKGQHFPAKYMKLMYAGKFLLDNNKVCDYNLEEKKFVIAVIKEPKKQVVPEFNNATEDLMAEINRGAHNGSEREGANSSNQEMMIQSIQEFGFGRAEVEHAMVVNSNHPERAIDYLLTNASSSSTGGQSVSNFSRSSETYGPNVSRPETTPSSSTILPSQERISELFHEINSVSGTQIQAQNLLDPEAVEVLQDMFPPTDWSTSLNSQCGPLGSSSQRAFQASSDSTRFSDFQSRRNESLHNMQHDHGDLYNQISISETEQQALDRLKHLGFSQEQAVEAYFCCDKDENAAANYLFNVYG